MKTGAGRGGGEMPETKNKKKAQGDLRATDSERRGRRGGDLGPWRSK